jgi:hypothetical protein
VLIFLEKTKQLDPISKKQNEDLPHDIIKRGFPLVVVLDSKGNSTGKASYKNVSQTNISLA